MKKRLFLLFLAVFVVCSLPACQQERSVGGYFAFLEKDFRAEIRGTLHEIDFSATVEKNTAGGYISIHYLTPETLKGVTLYQNDRETVCLDADGFQIRANGDEFDGLLLPLSYLTQTKEILRIRKTEGNTDLTLEGETLLTLGKEGHPITLCANRVRFSVVWWESDPTKSPSLSHTSSSIDSLIS